MKSRKSGSVIFIVLAAALTVVLLFVRSFAVELAYPVERACGLVKGFVWEPVAGLFGGSAARLENVRLRRELSALTLVRGDAERLATENARLRRALDYVARQPEEWLPAAVLSTDGGAGVRDTLRVSRGSLAGVREGAVVVVPEGLVGRVVSVTPHTAEVLLLTDPSMKVACEAESRTGVVRGILSGGTPDRLVIRHLRSAAEALPQAKVVTSGLGGVFPRGLEVGILLTVSNGVRNAEGEVRPQVDYSTLEDVFIRRDQ